MNKLFWIILSISSMTQTFAMDTEMGGSNPNSDLLLSPYPVYIIKNSGVINHPTPGAIEAFLPTDNSYVAAPGCYVACYSHQTGIYSVGPRIFVKGQVRVKGQYAARICQPEGYANTDISKENQFTKLCAEKISGCKNNQCWGGGDTGGWFGVQ